MDVNYLYSVANCSKNDYSNANGEFFKGLFENVQDMDEDDKDRYTQTGLNILGIAGNWLSNRKLNKDLNNSKNLNNYNYNPIPETPNSNTALYIGIGALTLVGVGIAIYLSVKK